jgi:hypothetical protein
VGGQTGMPNCFFGKGFQNLLLKRKSYSTGTCTVEQQCFFFIRVNMYRIRLKK